MTDWRWKVLVGDCRDLLKGKPTNSIDAVVCDPPYGLEFMGKDWDNLGATTVGAGRTSKPGIGDRPTEWVSNRGWNGYRCRTCGHLGHGGSPCTCEHPDFGPADDRWQRMQAWYHDCFSAVLPVLKPGGHLLAFGGTRTFHRMTVAIEDAGFEIRDCLCWLYGCLPDDAEILTEYGWKRGVDVHVGERVAAWDPDTEAITLEAVEDTTHAAFSGDLVVFRNDDTYQRLTPNHRVYHRPQRRQMSDGKRRAWFDDSWVVDEAARIDRWIPKHLPLAGLHDGQGIGGDDYAALLGWVWTEGCFDARGSGVRIYQSPKANPTKCAEIDTLLDRLGISYRRYERDRTNVVSPSGVHEHAREVCWFFSGNLARRIRADLPNKSPSWALLWQMTQSEKCALWTAAMRGDGSGDAFYQKNRAVLEWAQALLAVTGQCGRIAERGQVGGYSHSVLSIRRSATTQLQSRHLKASAEYYEGRVWCVKVRTGAFVARSNGKVFITGNSGMPKHKSQLKPAWEPVVLARKPCDGSEKASIAKWGVGGLFTRDCVIPGTPSPTRFDPSRHDYEGWRFNVTGKETAAAANERGGRHPANVCLDEDAAHLLDEQAGERKSGAMKGSYKGFGTQGIYGEAGYATREIEASTGGASRFFYSSKATKRERNIGLDNGTNGHPTVKPVNLMRWLVRLVCPPGGLVLDPFAGSGSTGMACLLEGRRFVGIDLSQEYLDVARNRIAHVERHGEAWLEAA